MKSWRIPPAIVEHVAVEHVAFSCRNLLPLPRGATVRCQLVVVYQGEASLSRYRMYSDWLLVHQKCMWCSVLW